MPRVYSPRTGPPFIEPDTAPGRVIIDVWTVPFSPTTLKQPGDK
jgi:hypothetical protein